MMTDSCLLKPWKGTGWPIAVLRKPSITTAVRDYLCTRDGCCGLLRKPILLDCAHRVCKQCFEILLGQPVPLCHACVATFTDGDHEEEGMFAEPSYPPMSEMPDGRQRGLIDPDKCLPDRAAAKEIGRLEVTCPYGCGVQQISGRPLQIRTLEKHMEECTQRLVSCPKCTEAVKHSDLQIHLGTGCPFRLMDCPNECGVKSIPGMDLSKHLAECVKKPPTCRLCMKSFYGSHHSHLITECFATKCPLGCTDVNSKQLIINHMDDEEKFPLHFLALYDMMVSSKEAQEKNRGSTVQSEEIKSQMTAILDRLLQLDCRSERAERQLGAKINHLDGPTATGVLRNAGQVESNKKELKQLDTLYQVFGEDVNKMKSSERNYRQLLDTVNRSESSFTTRLDSIEALSQRRQNEIEQQEASLADFELTSYTGRLIWRIDRVLSKRNEAHISRCFTSYPFYTETYGYKMCAKIYLNGDGLGRNSHISLMFAIMKGEFDALLQWPFPHQVTMKLKNQTARPDIVSHCQPDSSSLSFSRPVSEINRGSGFPQFATQSLMFDPENGFVIDDTTFIEIIVNNSLQAPDGIILSMEETHA